MTCDGCGKEKESVKSELDGKVFEIPLEIYKLDKDLSLCRVCMKLPKWKPLIGLTLEHMIDESVDSSTNNK